MMGIDLAIRRKNASAIIDVVGNIGYSDVTVLQEYIKQNITRRTSNVILNMKKTPIVSSSAFPLMYQLHETLTNTEKNLFLMNVNDELHETLQNQGYQEKFKFITNENLNSILES